MIDLETLQLFILPVGAVVIALLGLFLNRRSPEQLEAETEAVLQEARQERQDIDQRLQLIEELLAERQKRYLVVRRSPFRDPASGRIKVRPEARAALSRIVAAE